MKALSVIELSKLYGMTRQAIYKQINKGNLSKNSDGKINLSEALRVFGEPAQRVNLKQTTDTQKLSEVHLLEKHVHMLQKQLEIAQEREQFQRDELKAKNNQLQAKDNQIYSLQLLLGAPRSQEAPNIKDEDIRSPSKNTLNEKSETEVSNEHNQPLQKRSYKSKFFSQLRKILE